MARFNNGEWVLIKGLQSGYVVARVVRRDGDGYQVQHGMTSSYYSPQHIHKCPATLHPAHIKEEENI